mgnify:CR=1 FL=1
MHKPLQSLLFLASVFGLLFFISIIFPTKGITLAEKIKDENFANVGKQLIQFLILICRNLPCPECAQHAKEFWSKVKVQNINSREDFKGKVFNIT